LGGEGAAQSSIDLSEACLGPEVHCSTPWATTSRGGCIPPVGGGINRERRLSNLACRCHHAARGRVKSGTRGEGGGGGVGRRCERW